MVNEERRRAIGANDSNTNEKESSDASAIRFKRRSFRKMNAMTRGNGTEMDLQITSAVDLGEAEPPLITSMEDRFSFIV